jgi:hypothetical protein
MRLFLTTLFVLAMAIPAMAGEVPLQWDSATGADGYRIVFGTNNNELIYSINVGQAVQRTVTDLECGETYLFFVEAYNEAGSTAASNILTTTISDCPQLPIIPEGWEVDSLKLKPAQ